MQDSTSDRQQIKRAVRSLKPGGSTALYDAIVEGLARLQSGKQKKKALLLVTDGRDTSSQTRLGEAVATTRRSEAIIYALGIGHGDKGSFGHLSNVFEDTVDIDALRQLAEPTGGRAVLLEGKHKKNGVDQIDQAALAVSAKLARAQFRFFGGAFRRTLNTAEDGWSSRATSLFRDGDNDCD